MPHPLYAWISLLPPTLGGPLEMSPMLRGIQWCLIITQMVKSSLAGMAYKMVWSVQSQFPFHRTLGALAIDWIYRGFPGGPVVKTLHSLEGAWVQSSVRELRSHMLPNMAKKKEERRV